MLQFGFYELSAVILLMPLLILRYKTDFRKTVIQYAGYCSIWGVYLIAVEKLGVLENFGMPPRLPLFIVLPATGFMVFITGRESFKGMLQSTPLYLPVFLQSFRILVEALIYGAFLEGVFPQRVTFEGLNFDILAGLTAPFAGIFIRKQVMGLSGLLIWNIFSLMILAMTLYAFISTYYDTRDNLTALQHGLVRFPYLLLPAVLLPAAIFLHTFSIRQIFLKRLNSR